MKKVMLSIATPRILGLKGTTEGSLTTRVSGTGFVQGTIQYMSANTTRQTISLASGKRAYQRRWLVESQRTRRLLNTCSSTGNG